MRHAKSFITLTRLAASAAAFLVVASCGSTNESLFQAHLPSTVFLALGESRKFETAFQNTYPQTVTFMTVGPSDGVKNAKGDPNPDLTKAVYDALPAEFRDSINNTTNAIETTYTAPMKLGIDPNGALAAHFDQFALRSIPDNSAAPHDTVFIKVYLAVKADPSTVTLPVNTSETLLRNPITKQFTASVPGDGRNAPGSQVIWKLYTTADGTGNPINFDPNSVGPEGRIDPDTGLYTSGTTPGTYYIFAESKLQHSANVGDNVDHRARAIITLEKASGTITVQ